MRAHTKIAKVAATVVLTIGTLVAAGFGWSFVQYVLEGGRELKPRFGGDFAFFWSVSAALRSGGVGAVLDPEALRTFAPYAVVGDFYHWFYPPIALFICAPISRLPFVHAFVAWSLAGFILYLGAALVILRRPSALLLAAGYSAVFHTFVNGQLTFFLFAILGLALALLPSRPMIAGILIGALAFKPHHAVLLPIALVAGRHWRAFASATATVIVLVFVTTFVYGVDAWPGSLHGLAHARWLVETGHVAHYKYSSVFTAVRIAGGGVRVAYAIQMAVAIVAACAVAWLWSRPVRHELQASGLVICGLLANFYWFHYDLTLLGLALLFALRLGGWSFVEWVAWGATWLGIAYCSFLARDTGVQLVPLVLGVLLFIIVRRARLDADAAGARPQRLRERLTPAFPRSSAG